MKAVENMKIKIKVNFSTDDDYRIEGYDFSNSIYKKEEDINLVDRKFKVFFIGYNKHPFNDDYTFLVCIDCEDASYCQMYARNYLEELLCNIRFLSTHYYIMPHFYEMFDKAIKSIGHENHFYDSINGNYDGTDLEICVDED